jgi:hypothetical protein
MIKLHIIEQEQKKRHMRMRYKRSASFKVSTKRLQRPRRPEHGTDFKALKLSLHLPSYAIRQLVNLYLRS